MKDEVTGDVVEVTYNGFNKEERELFHKEYANLIELQIGFEGAAANGVEVSAEVTEAIQFATSKVDPNGDLRIVYNQICNIYEDQLTKEA